MSPRNSVKLAFVHAQRGWANMMNVGDLASRTRRVAVGQLSIGARSEVREVNLHPDIAPIAKSNPTTHSTPSAIEIFLWRRSMITMLTERSIAVRTIPHVPKVGTFAGSVTARRITPRFASPTVDN